MPSGPARLWIASSTDCARARHPRPASRRFVGEPLHPSRYRSSRSFRARRLGRCSPPSRPIWPPAPRARRRSSTPRTAAIATRSRTAPIADRASASLTTFLTTARPPRWRASPCVRAVSASTRACSIAASMRRRTPVLRVDLGCARSPRGESNGQDPIRAAARALREGRIVAVKGIGGFHLACDAGSEAAVEQLRRRKRRDHKPFAVMTRDLPAAEELADLSRRSGACSAPRSDPSSWRHGEQGQRWPRRWRQAAPWWGSCFLTHRFTTCCYRRWIARWS